MGILALLGVAAEVVPAAISLWNKTFGGDAQTGVLPDDATPETIDAAFKRLPKEKQESYAARLKGIADSYRGETDRLVVEGGKVDAPTLNALDVKTRGKVAFLRMTTRPRIVLRMSHVILLPAYIYLFDAALLVVRTLTGKAFPLLSVQIKDTPLPSLYDKASWPATVIVITYMTLRQISKSKDDNEDSPLAAIVGGISKVKDFFVKK